MKKNEDILNLLSTACDRFTRKEVSAALERTPRTVTRWLKGESRMDPALKPALERLLSAKGRTVGNSDFTMIDLFAGIGGIRKGFEAHGGRCVFTSEYDSYCQKTYSENFSDSAPIWGDINRVVYDSHGNIPEHDLLLAGFPCQPFSIAGVSKKNALGRPHGFACQEQGNLFFVIADIIKELRPKAFLLENVKNLKSHDRGKTFQIIIDTLENVLGYNIFHRVIDAKGFVPQHRERIYIAGFDQEIDFSWDDFQHPGADASVMKDVLHSENGTEEPEEPYTTGRKAVVNSKYTLSDHLWTYLQNYAEKHRAKGNGFGYGLVGPADTARTLSARYYKDGSEILVTQRARKNPRRLTPRECARLMGYGDDFIIPVSDTRAYTQFGNSVVVPVIKEIARIIKPHLV